jgi:superoxide dismutase, Cu-Zn family
MQKARLRTLERESWLSGSCGIAGAQVPRGMGNARNQSASARLGSAWKAQNDSQRPLERWSVRNHRIEHTQGTQRTLAISRTITKEHYVMNKSKLCGLLALLLVPVVGCGDESEEDPGKVIAMAAGPLQVYGDVMNNPIPPSATASATAWDLEGKLKLTLSVAGFPASRDFGAHLHKLTCDNSKAGGHYQHTAAPAMDQVNTPTYANTTNEAWLDFTTKADGTASVETTQAWLPRPGDAKSIVIHATKTDANGRAGDKLGCLPLSLP